MIERIGSIAIILYANHVQDGIEFLTPGDYSQQLGYMKRPKGYEVSPHYHNEVKREITRTQEVLFVKSGCLVVRLYDDNHDYLVMRLLRPGDTILLAGGGHGFEFLEDSEVIEVKQGPYSGDADKTYI